MEESVADRTVRVQLDDGAYIPERAHETDAGADLRTPIDLMLWGHSSFSVDTGVHIELPHGYYARIASKSGLNCKHDIISEGVIDEGYTGSIVVRLHNLSKNPHVFAKGDKISQLIIEPVVYADFDQVDRVEGGERGDGGFGSTGTK